MAKQNPSASVPLAPLLDHLALWPHQRAAIQKMRQYLADFKKGRAEGSGLIHMPTGSGKTGVITVLARCLPEIGGTLILTPRIALRRQLFEDVNGRFLAKLKPVPPLDEVPKNVVELAEAGDLENVRDLSTTVLVTTFQMAHGLFQDHIEAWNRIVKGISLVIVDEGHYEPAATWSLITRSLPHPKIILTATPYRNDLKVFDINLEYVYSYTFQEAVEEHFLRDVEIIPLAPTKDPNQFVRDILSFYRKKFRGMKDAAPRVIIRCDQADEIRQIETALDARKCHDYIAIHERFSDKGKNPRERRNVPDPGKETARFWIHQFKLLEGIDDPRFQLLALFEPLSDARSLVQQIGRIVRNPGRQAGAKGYVLDHTGGHQLDLWLGFANYDEALRVHGKEGLNLAIGKAWKASLIHAQPICAYLKDRFRIPLNLEQLNPRQDLLLPRAVNLRYKKPNFNLEHLCRMIEKTCKEDDRVYQRYMEDDAVIYLYITFNNSPLLGRSYFVEPRLGVTYFKEMEDLVAYFDSSGYLPLDDFGAAGLGPVVDYDTLKSLFSCNDKSYLTSVSLRNSNLGPVAIRSRSIRAENIQRTIEAFDDYAQICTNATGYRLKPLQGRKWKAVRRYIGFESGRITDPSPPCSLEEYEVWLAQIADAIGNHNAPIPTFERYAEKCVTPPAAVPKYIHIDIPDSDMKFVALGNGHGKEGEALQVRDESMEIGSDRHFTLLANGEPCDAKIHYDEDTRQYHLESADLDRRYRNTDPTDKRGVVAYLNQEQLFQVVPATGQLIYTQGTFFQPYFKAGPRYDPKRLDVCQILTGVPLLHDIKEEKGKPGNPRGWDKDTLFGIIDRLGEPAGLKGEFGSPDIMICDDMRTEMADFVLAYTKLKRVIFIHAKADEDLHPYSGKELQEVLSQAVKNIRYLGMYNEDTPPNLKDWNGKWVDPHTGCKVSRRIRIGSVKGLEAWETIRSILHHPLAEREVWAFLGRILSKSQFGAMLHQDPPKPEAVQAAYLLRGAMANVSSIGAKLRVFCYP